MIAHEDTFFVFADKTSGKYLGIDSYSGGYPWLTDNIESGKLFYSMNSVAEFKRDYIDRHGFKECSNLVLLEAKKTIETKRISVGE